MRVLVVSPRIPFPPVDGAGLRTYHLVRALAETHEVTLVAFDYGDAHERHLVGLGECTNQVVRGLRGLGEVRRGAARGGRGRLRRGGPGGDVDGPLRYADPRGLPGGPRP